MCPIQAAQSEDRQDSLMHFGMSEALETLKTRVRSFVDTEVIPLEAQVEAHPADALLKDLKQKARSAGLFGPQLSKSLGGMGLNWRELAVVLETAGRSLLGPAALHAAAPDEGNMHLLDHVADPSQRERYLLPLAKGETRSCFSMTEPGGAGADPGLLRTRAERDGDSWVINGRKWFITGAEGAAFTIVLAQTAEGPTMFLVPSGHPGFRQVRMIPTLDLMSPGGHCELLFEDCRVGAEAVLGEVGKGFDYAQLRLAPARLTHCMRWLGVAVRSVEIASAYVKERESFGKKLMAHQGVAFKIADAHIQIHAARLMIWHAAWMLDQGHKAKHESSMAKTFVSEVVHRVIDDMVQITGAYGISEDAQLSVFYRENRPFRIYDGPSEVHRMSIARRVLYKDLEP